MPLVLYIPRTTSRVRGGFTRVTPLLAAIVYSNCLRTWTNEIRNHIDIQWHFGQTFTSSKAASKVRTRLVTKVRDYSRTLPKVIIAPAKAPPTAPLAATSNILLPVKYLCLRKYSFVLLYIVNDAAPSNDHKRYIWGKENIQNTYGQKIWSWEGSISHDRTQWCLLLDKPRQQVLARILVSLWFVTSIWGNPADIQI